MKIGDKITDGSATFIVRSKKGGGTEPRWCPSR